MNCFLSTVEDDFCHQIPSTAAASSSAIWQMEIRENVEHNMIKTAELNNFRSSLIVPGFDEQLLSKVNTVIPIMLVQRSVSGQSGNVCLSQFSFIIMYYIG